VILGLAGTAAVAVAWNRGGRRGGWALLGLGTLGVVVGIGVGLRGIILDALGLGTVMALLALPTGLTAVGLGVSRITRGLRPFWRLISGFLIVLLVAIVTWTLTPAVLATRAPSVPLGSAIPSDFGLEAVDVRFVTADGVELFAWYVPPPDGKVVILRHGAGSTAASVLAHARVLAANHYGVLITDARGHGRSAGDPMEFGWFGDLDIAAAVDFLEQQPEVDRKRIAVVGLSMGGEESIGAGAVDERIAAVVAEGATARTDADKAWLIDEYGWRGWLQTKLEWVQYSVTDILTDADRPTSLASAARGMSPRPILLIVGEATIDEPNAALHIKAGSNGNVTIWTVPNAGHIGGLGAQPAQWEQVVVRFLDGALSG
jgi:pimeloyl-ACP methyl ester carboxylesterase